MHSEVMKACMIAERIALYDNMTPYILVNYTDYDKPFLQVGK
jgi:hypothetical protein